MEAPITPEELQAAIRDTFRAAKRRRVLGLVALLVGLCLILVVSVGFLSAEYQPENGTPSRQRGP